MAQSAGADALVARPYWCHVAPGPAIEPPGKRDGQREISAGSTPSED